MLCCGAERFSATPITVAGILETLRAKNAPMVEGDVVEWTEKGFLRAAAAGPVFIKCFEQWCGHCKHLKKVQPLRCTRIAFCSLFLTLCCAGGEQPWAQSATHFKGKVTFFEIECSKTQDSKAFCAKNGVKGYPTLILFNSNALLPLPPLLFGFFAALSVIPSHASRLFHFDRGHHHQI